ncbi:hypothetical protein AVEN_79656-1 [Araneus ventricosus]|uniref:Uncharacterized protein n=1 Tax=Araneus ventricosus TaxID=182803 RepID=A0A4Y2T772_ARAVE|nr:hypothetical protein AVEN_79656-1 [Araneus ventricosus]
MHNSGEILWSYPFSSCAVDDPRKSAELHQVHEPVHPKEIQSQQRIRNEIMFGKPQACKNMIRCGLFCNTFWAGLRTLKIIRESRTSDMPTKEASESCLVASVAVNKFSSRYDKTTSIDLTEGSESSRSEKKL